MVTDYDRLLLRASDVQLNEWDRKQAALTNYANQFVRYAYFFLAFFLAFAVDKQISAWKGELQTQAYVGYILAVGSFAVFYAIYRCLLPAGDPRDQFVFQTSNEEQITEYPKQAIIRGLAISHIAAPVSSPLLPVPAPLASLNTKPPPNNFNHWLLRQQMQAKNSNSKPTASAAKREESSISPDVLRFNPSMKSMMHRT